jgi:hypothetical protein
MKEVMVPLVLILALTGCRLFEVSVPESEQKIPLAGGAAESKLPPNVPLATVAGESAAARARNGFLWGALALAVLAVISLALGLWLHTRTLFLAAAGAILASLFFVALAVYLEWLLLGVLALIIGGLAAVAVMLYRAFCRMVATIETAKETDLSGNESLRFDNSALEGMGVMAKRLVNAVQGRL